MNRNRLILRGLLTVLVALMVPASLSARKKKETQTEKPRTAYQKIVEQPGTKRAVGFINLYLAKNKVYMEIPRSVWRRRILMGSMVDRVSNPQESSVGYSPATPMEVMFCRTDSLVRLMSVTERPADSGNTSIAEALKKSFADKILKQFAVKAYSPDSAAVIDVTDYVFGNDAYMNPIDPKGYNGMDGWIKRESNFRKERSAISGVSAYSDNVSVSCSMSYDVSMSLFGLFSVLDNVPFTAVIKRSFLLLPEEGGYRRRVADARIGTKWSGVQDFNPALQGSRTQYFVNRWNLKPDSSLVFYVDTLLPDSWKASVLRSAETWNAAFRKIGYRKALDVRPYPNDSTFDANSLSNSCVRYVLSPSGTVTDSQWTDPQTGEILNANIYMPHNLASQIQLDAFLQTSAFEPKARQLKPDAELVSQALQTLLLRSWGHCLGLSDNMAGSIAYPIDSLQCEAFVKTHGLSASVMDVLPMNYLQTAGTYRKGAPLSQQVLGAYDEWALHYLYADSGKDSCADELPVLRGWASERNRNPLLLYKRPQSTKAYYDPRGMRSDLGNDAVRSAMIAFQNLAYVIANANAWLDKEDLDYEERVPLYGHIINQADEYVKQVLQHVGGFYLNDTYQDDSCAAFQSVPKDIQRKSFLWMLKALDDMSWMDNADLLNHCALTGSPADYSQKFFGNLIFVQLGGMWLSERKSDNPYTQAEAASDLMDWLFRESRAGKAPADFKRFMQGRMADAAITWSNVNGNADKSASSSSSKSLTDYHPYWGMKAIESIGYMGQQGNERFWYGLLLDLQKEFRKAKAVAATRALRDEYDYRLYTLKRALEK